MYDYDYLRFISVNGVNCYDIKSGFDSKRSSSYSVVDKSSFGTKSKRFWRPSDLSNVDKI